ncbi:hypothetical protein SLEP1_g48010 [Rubroshorea leprosula]|uniref:Uncharacterized protein n=1 Tax=Rubroshorea leprosula TaxID=152421 RepID=A0AAV5LUB6_9ROSI|nr:hypothetical protein SLEP1_g48010 [Rubroshorea leprosula]
MKGLLRQNYLVLVILKLAANGGLSLMDILFFLPSWCKEIQVVLLLMLAEKLLASI